MFTDRSCKKVNQAIIGFNSVQMVENMTCRDLPMSFHPDFNMFPDITSFACPWMSWIPNHYISTITRVASAFPVGRAWATKEGQTTFNTMRGLTRFWPPAIRAYHSFFSRTPFTFPTRPGVLSRTFLSTHRLIANRASSLLAPIFSTIRANALMLNTRQVILLTNSTRLDASMCSHNSLPYDVYCAYYYSKKKGDVNHVN